MLNIDGGRINDPIAIDPGELAEACAKRGQLVVQFGRPDAYTPAKLSLLNEACRLAPDSLQVRFYGHYQGAFDATMLRHLPEVRDLGVDCLTKILQEEEVGKLPHLKRLIFGVFEFDQPDFLQTIELHKLERLVLIENRKRNIDLHPLSKCESLRDLFINGHSKGIHAIAGLPRLRKLSLGAYAKTHPLDFVGAIPSLKELTLVLGGRLHIDDMSSTTLEMLQILRVRGLSTLGDLSRFSLLSALRVEDQLQLVEVDLNGANLERLWLANCKMLVELPGLERQHRLKEFRASVVALDMNLLRDRDWPQTARSINLFSGSQKWNDDAIARLKDRGLGEKGAIWP
ncbi:hypothetical protein [Sphingomonas sp. Leaf198]|uniref:hypothetical protein n=2 Tax=unclassified Sphingomonas TaxID=196159 RepID=UPI0006F67988|nr:hypothetical protein [Sphingomonas sp. Leaf198]KQS49605.1 hypothetical protein ASG20_11540 [Sphingomonas sp. Leaf198]